ncbi:hypothetical protein NLX83_13740 [Allokutzneria sp. A3M-2-11 16]|uniref:hypothetical protein n=1 Tax=Allokutzneria sp. A3M-2-11 16 TaxID=2962043 RepID=UPI0020B785FE|nr:hypothetical protein [Allokutzneria sp. A3M-2-11 16]MCP3800321.1 hypothetical protein [Allokutzneria sp. A3M-2-11 16]
MSRAPVPVAPDAAAVVVMLLRSLLAGRADRVAEKVQVSTEMGRNPEGGPPSLPWVLVRDDGGRWEWPAVASALVRLSVWHHNERSAKALCTLALTLLACHEGGGGLIVVDALALPAAGTDPYTGAPLATASCTAFLRAGFVDR